MARRPPSTRSLSTDQRPPSRRTSSNSSNTNIFSDDYDLENSNPFVSSSPTDSIGSGSDRLSLDHPPDSKSNPREYTPPGLPGNVAGMSQISGMSGAPTTDASTNPQRTVSISSHSVADTHRTLSTSSRFSIPRAPSPYNGPTAPSQPYGLYPQATRASSVASEATLRPLDRPFVPGVGPEHPYGMYQQNTVPEEEDDSQAHIPLGFPSLGQSSQSGSNSSGDEVGDIVGSDGHVEQLPPYSRYADNVIAKGDMARIDPPSGDISDASSSTAITPPVAASSSNIELAPVAPGVSSDEVARKEGLTEHKRRRRLCFGIPFWTFVIIVAVVITAALLGGVIGGVVGTKKGTDHGAATTTVWLDADPAQTDGSTGSCPTGHYTLTLNQTEEVDTCVVDPNLKNTWGCMDFAKLGINVFELPNNGPIQVVFDDYSIRPQQFKYGPQPPDFNGTAFTMQPYLDKEDDELGVALFFSVLFDKLSILPAEALTAPNEKKRSVPAAQLLGRTNWEEPNWLKIGDQPWYCFWNSTVSEFWIFLDEDLDDWGQWAATSTITSGYSTSTPNRSYVTSGSIAGFPSSTDPVSKGSPSPSYPTNFNDPYWNGQKLKRQTSQIGAPDIFPKLVKMVEKRKPHSNIQPYCQQMQVLNNWQIMPIPTVPTICVDEDEYAAATGSGSKRMARRKRSPDTISQLSSNCICEWFSDY